MERKSAQQNKNLYVELKDGLSRHSSGCCWIAEGGEGNLQNTDEMIVDEEEWGGGEDK